MFEKARIKLTLWYLLIIMLISVSFSALIYRGIGLELNRLEHFERIRLERRIIPRPILNADVIGETKKRIILVLITINGAILIGSTAAGYFLAGRTLAPIANMVEEQNRFITDASHELRTPLTALKSEIEVHIRNKNLTIHNAIKLLKSNLEEVNNLQQLSDGLIKLTQFQETKGMPVERIKLVELGKNALRKVSALAKSKRISIINTLPDSAIEGNAMLLTELLVIFLDNAIKYSTNGKKIRLSAEKIDGHVAIHITDQGVGIHKEDIPHLFNRFYRVDKSRSKTTVSGYGLGLAIAKQIIERHNGSVNVESAIRKGTTFTVKLPIKHIS